MILIRVLDMRWTVLLFLTLLLFSCCDILAQNTGIGTFNAKNTLHVSRQADNPVVDPIRIDSLQYYQSASDTSFVVCDPDSGIFRYMPLEKLVAKSRIFYPPSIAISISTTATGQTLDLHQTYMDLFSSPMVTSPGASLLPTYTESELEYYVLDYDTSIFDNVSISEQGVLTYDIILVPSSNYAYFNVVFKVKE